MLHHGGSTEKVEGSHLDGGLHASPQYDSGSEPFPTLETPDHVNTEKLLPSLYTEAPGASAFASQPSPVTGLRLQTEQLAQKNRHRTRSTEKPSIPEGAEPTVYNAGLPVRNSSIRSTHSARQPRRDSLSPSSISSSPAVGPLADMTPLPSPISRYGSPGLWRTSIDGGLHHDPPDAEGAQRSPESDGRPATAGSISPKKRKIPTIIPLGPSQHALSVSDQNENARNTHRSISEYAHPGLHAPKPRNIAVSASGPSLLAQQLISSEDALHRERHLAEQRGLVPRNLPTPPASSKGSESDETQQPTSAPPKRTSRIIEYEARSLRSDNVRGWQAIRQLGEGQFSKVMLATREDISNRLYMDPLELEKSCAPRSLVAVKVCHHGPAGGADEKSVETSIKRELDLMKAIDHPSLVHLKAVSTLDRQTLFVLHYCPGGDLFDLANSNIDLLSASLIRRVFAELVGAVQYLHAKFIVHRDIKLENVLVNIRPDEIRAVNDWQRYESPVVVLSDLGLGREIPKPPESPLLRRRCGSEDYAAPEVLIGQEYDGRSTDAWALGVVLYTLMEGRMPFDPVPGSRRKRATSHKIATCDWQWVRFADDDGEWDPVKGKDFEGAREVVEGLIARKRDRWDLDRAQKTAWVSGGIAVSGELDRGDDDA